MKENLFREAEIRQRRKAVRKRKGGGVIKVEVGGSLRKVMVGGSLKCGSESR